MYFVSISRQHVRECLEDGNVFKLMTKEDVENVISSSLQPHGISFEIKTDFIQLIEPVDRALWFHKWDFLNSI